MASKYFIVRSSDPDEEYYAEKRRDMDELTPNWREMKHENGKPMFASNGKMLDENGNRSIFDDVDD